MNAAVLQDRLDPQFRPWQLGATMFTLMGAFALLVASIGLYSVVSYLVANRRHEIGVRIALGAQGRDVVRLTLSSGFALAMTGVVVGLALAFGATRFMEPLLASYSLRSAVTGSTREARTAGTTLATIAATSRLAVTTA